MSELIVLDQIKNQNAQGFEEVLLPSPPSPPNITLNLSERVRTSCNYMSYSNLLPGSYFSPSMEASATQPWWIPTSCDTSDVYTQWYESAYRAALQVAQERNSSGKIKVKYLKRKSEVVDAKVDAEKVANAQNELSTLMKSLKCDLCNAVMNSTLQAKLHYQGKPHQKKVSMFLNQSVKKLKHADGQTSFINNNNWTMYCELCKTWFTSTTDASQHYAGKKHLKVAFGLGRAKALKKNQPHTTKPIDPTSQSDFDVTHQPRIPSLSESPSISVSPHNLVSQSSQPCQTLLRCDLCGISVNRQDQLDMHKSGTKHIKMLKLHGLSSISSDAASIISKPIDYSIHRTPSGQYYCALCNLSLNSEIAFGRHMESKKHKNQENPKRQTPSSLAVKKSKRK